MLVISREVHEIVDIYVGDERIGEVSVAGIRPGKVRLGLTAPQHVRFVRRELTPDPASMQSTPREPVSV